MAKDAEALVGAGDLAAGCRVAVQALEVADRARYQRVVRQVRAFRQAAVPGVYRSPELDERLGHLAAR